jgi:hypothetical protein
MRLGKKDSYYYTSSACFTLQVSRVVFESVQSVSFDYYYYSAIY